MERLSFSLARKEQDHTFFPSVITVVHWQHYTAVISLKVYVRAGSCTDTRNIISEFKVTALCLTCSTQLWGENKNKKLI